MATTAGATRSTMPVAIISGVAGGALALFPLTVGPLIGLSDPRQCRVIGLLDLALVPGLVHGRPRWPWLGARAFLNLPMAAFALRQGHRSGRLKNAGVFAAVMTLATIDDIRSLRAMLRNR